MSELKAISGNEIREDIDYNTRGIDPEDKEWRKYGKELCDTLYYNKSEADKVIAELEESHKKEVGQLLILNREQANAANRLRDSMEQALRHQKFKRCLAMAMWCRIHDEFTQLESERLGLPQRTLFLEYRNKAMWWNKWRKRWLTLADKYKEGNV